MKTPQFYIAARTKKKRWLAFCWALAAVVVFCTVYALILPGVSVSRDTICGVEAHEHSALCYAPDENATLTALPEEDREAVQSLMAQIDGLPAPTELEEAFAALVAEPMEVEAETETDTETATPNPRADAVAELSVQIAAIEEAFLSLSPAQQETVDNWPKLMETKQQLCYLDYGERIAALGEEDEAAKEELKLALDDAHATAALNDATYSELMALLLPPEPAADDAENDSEDEAANEDNAPAEEIGTAEEEEVTSEEGAYSPQVQTTTGNVVSDSSAVQPQASTIQTVDNYTEITDDGPDNKSDSNTQVNDYGGTNATNDVSVSKIIRGTELENVFDITLKVETTQKIEEVTTEPDMAVVIVMDISNTMTEHFGGGTEGTGVTRYAAAMMAAENFLDKFAENNSLGISKVGYVAFNTDAHEIFDLQSCTDEKQANELKNKMRTATGNIINVANYKDLHTRFTNIEGGLKMASDMLSRVSNQNKYIILLTDGFPTTYVKDKYNGYDPYTSQGTVGNDGVFYDGVLKKYCSYGTSYSNKAAIRAREKAESIRDSGTTIFSIGVDVGGQTIQKYITSSESSAKSSDGYSIVDREDANYEIGSADSTEAYKNWLKSNIGSGYYYDSTDSDKLNEAFTQIFKEIKTQVETASKADWVASDSIQDLTQNDVIEFIGFYDNSNPKKFVSGNLIGSYAENGENTASLIKKESQEDADKISWDLKNSGYTQREENNKTYYTYQLTYRVRLTNEATEFDENGVYNTNGTTMLQYRVVQSVNENVTMQSYKIPFPIPSVHGYLGELTFQKVDPDGKPVSGAEFTLSHATSCSKCRGNGTPVTTIESQKEIYCATSNEDGTVKFQNIPSGHTYTLTETPPSGYACNGNIYTVTVAYDVVTVNVTDASGNPVEWNGKITNITSHKLPETGGLGKETLLGLGILLALGALLLLRIRKPSRSP